MEDPRQSDFLPIEETLGVIEGASIDLSQGKVQKIFTIVK
jgi:hypothetical protein